MIRPILLTLIILCSGVYFACQSQSNQKIVASEQQAVIHPELLQKKSIIEKTCTKCHGADKQKGKVRLDKLYDGLMTREKMELIKESMALIDEGEMPPKKEKILTENTIKEIKHEFTKILEDNLEVSRRENQTVYRRLNNEEYLNTVSDLFGFDPKSFNPTILFPDDQRHEGLNTIGSELKSTKFLTHEYLAAAHKVVDKMVRFSEKPKVKSYVIGPSKLHTRVKDEGSAILYGSFHSGDNTQGSEIYLKNFKAPEDGFYKFKVKATAKNRIHDLPKHLVKNDQEEPLRLGLKTGHFSNPNMHAVFDLIDGESWYECKIWLNKDESPQLVYPNAVYSAHNYRFHLTEIPDIHKRLGISKNLTDERGEGYKRDRGYVYKNIYSVVKKLPIPKIHVNKVKVEGPYYDDWNPDHQNLIFNGQTLRESNWKKLLSDFIYRAFRQPTTEESLRPYFQLIEKQRAQGIQFSEAFTNTLKAVICSPRFLFIQEKDQDLNQYEIASRLSYFLWSSMPDASLFKAAKNNQLRSTEQISKQVERMLKSPKSKNFVTSFTSSWLQLYNLGGILPHNKLFKEFYTMNIQESIKKETYLYFEYVLTQNRSIHDFLDSNYSILDERLAKLYKLPKPELKNNISSNQYNGKAPSTGFAKYEFKDQRRGGLMGHASVLTVSANGVDTSPVVRGVWILENLLCSPPPPAPAGVAAIEPDTRGAKSIKDRLKKHQDDPNCASCHKKIDPIGFALENYNPIGQWRTKYRRKKVDASGNMNGKDFESIIGLKKILLEKKDSFADAFAEKMLTYAIGRKLTFLDEENLETLKTNFKAKDHQLKDLIRLICTNQLFIQK
ncbi:MAG: DUF1592 domain-containing protein [Lentisphaeraceae bacterium]|nr:DUF1592 domain-containing protein [Lentisphaeraceae bacterium]